MHGMRIGIVSRSWFTETKGGAERYIYELTKGLIRKGHSVISISRQDSDLPNEHITVKSSGLIMLGSALFSLRGSKITKELELDVLIVNQYWAEMTTLLVDIPSITILHDVGLYESEIAQSEKTRHFFRKRILRRVLRKTQKVIVPSMLTQRQTKEHLGVADEKLVIVPEGINLELFHPSKEPMEEPIILCTGRFSPNKGHFQLIKAFKEAKNEMGWSGILMLAGHYTEKHRDYFKRLQGKTGESIEILTDLSDEELAKLLRRSMICVYPSLSDEGWGLTVVEAFATGKPVICSDIFRETGVADEERACIVTRNNVYELQNALVNLIASPEERSRLGSNGLKYARTLSWEKLVDTIEGIIYEVL
jgi:glycosyltransferase involved in cell wall biosynthesis